MIEEKMRSLGILLPETPSPAGSYVPAIQVGNLVFTSGQIPRWNGEWKSYSQGKVGLDLTKEDAYEAAKLCSLNALAAIKHVVNSLNKITRIAKVGVFVSSSPGFTDQPFVADGASNLFKSIFEERGYHVRFAVGVSELPLNSSVEIEVTASLDGSDKTF